MTTETTQTTPQLVRALKLRDLVLFNLVAVLGLRHLGTTAKFGPGSLLMWLIAAVFFFVPQKGGVIVASDQSLLSTQFGSTRERSDKGAPDRTEIWNLIWLPAASMEISI